MGSCCCLIKLLLATKALDGCIQHEVLLDGDLRPQDVKLGAHAQVLPDGCHVVFDAQAIDDGIACRQVPSQCIAI